MRTILAICMTTIMSLAFVNMSHAQDSGYIETVITEVHWVEDGLILKLATGHLVKTTAKEQAKTPGMEWRPYETAAWLMLDNSGGGALINFTYFKKYGGSDTPLFKVKILSYK